MSGLDWQDGDPAAYDPDEPLKLLEKAAAAEPDKRAMQAVWAVQSMLAAEPTAAAVTVAREHVKRHKLMGARDFDGLLRAHQARSDRPAGETDVKSAATMLVELAQEHYTFGVTSTGDTFAVPNHGPRVVAMLRGGKTSLRALLAREYFTRTGRAAAQQALADALLVIEGIAQDETETELYLRAAQHEGALWLDLGDNTGRAACITRTGWTVEESAPVLFKRTALTGALPEPLHGGDIGELWKWLNVAKEDRPLVLAALVAALFSGQPQVVLAIFGEQGTGKTTAVKVLVMLLDPGPVPVRKPPRDADSWVTAAAGSWVVGLDNLSDVPPWLSDSLCRASTGDGDVRRKLYTDGDFAVFAFRRCIIFDAIDVGALAPDLADRTVAITLDLIQDEDRTDEETFWSEWAAMHPQLLGAVLTLAERVMARLPEVKLTRKPRMADFARILAAVDAELGTEGFARYSQQAANLAGEGLSGDSFAARIQAVIMTGFEGTSAELLRYVRPGDPEWKAPKDWPASTRAVTGKLRRLAPAFRKTGWQVTELPPGHQNAVRWQISPASQPETSRENAREPSQDSPGQLFASDASQREAPGGTSQDGPREETSAPGDCTICGDPLEQALLDLGFTDHGEDTSATAKPKGPA